MTFARAFDPVSLTEIGRLVKLMPNFDARSVNVLGVVKETVPMLASFLTDVATIEQVRIWYLAFGVWRLAFGIWLLAIGIWLLASL